jgi:hypothetical protein
MKKRLITALLAVVLVVGGVGATAGRLMPDAGQLFGVTPAGAASLSVESAAPLTPAGSGFTYQGRLKDGATPAEGPYDFQFSLYDEPTDGTLVSDPFIQPDQQVTEGLFTVLLDFGGSPFNGDARYLEISVRPVGGGEHTILSPRQPITPAPYALYALKTKGYKNVVTVSPEGGDFTSVQAALNSITTNSSTNKYLIWVGPGTYTERVTVKPYVDIEGSGELTTKITFTGSSINNTGTVVGANFAELRSVTVENTGGNTYAIALYNNSASLSMLHVTATASGGTSANFGVFNINSSSPNMVNLTITATGGSNTYAVYNNNSSSPTMTNVTARGSSATSTNMGVFNYSSYPTMTNVTATGAGGFNSYGVYNNSASPTMNNVIAAGSGGSSINSGVDNVSSSAPNMNNVTATAFGTANTNYGMSNDTSSPTIRASNISAIGGSSNYGVWSTTSGTVTIDNSKVTASTNTIVNGAITRVGASQLSGGAVVNSGGTLSCSASYDENYVSPGLNVCP